MPYLSALQIGEWKMKIEEMTLLNTNEKEKEKDFDEIFKVVSEIYQCPERMLRGMSVEEWEAFKIERNKKNANH